MVTDPIFGKIKGVVEYNGTAPGVRTGLDTVSTVYGDTAYVVDLGAVDPAVTTPTSLEKVIGVYVPSQTTKIKDAQILCVNGRMGNTFGDITLNAGTGVTYVPPVVAGVASTVATSEIPNSTPFSPLAMPTLDATEHDYQFLHLQLLADSAATTWDVAKAINPTGYYLVDIAITYEEKYSNLGPGGPSKDYYANKTNTEVWVKWNGTMQLIGCLANDLELQLGIEFSEIKKGATDSTVSMAINTRDNMISNIRTYGFGTWIMSEIAKGTMRITTDGLYEVLDIDLGWKQIEGVEFFLWTHNNSGQDIWIKINEGVIISDGNVPYGSAEANLPFSIKSLSKIQIRKSVNYIDHVKIAVTGSVT